MPPPLKPDEVRWADTAPQPEPQWVQLLRPGPRDPVGAVVTSASLEIVYSHWMGSRSQPCTLPTGRCAGCRAGCAAQRKGYLAGWQARRQRDVLLELSQHAMLNLPEFARLDDFAWRGCGVRLYRTNSKANAPVLADVKRIEPAPVGLPEPFDVRAALVYLWGTAWIAFGDQVRKIS